MKKTSDTVEFQRTVIWVLGTVEELMEKGLMARTEPYEYLTPKGRALFDKIKASGFKPRRDMIDAACAIFARRKTHDGGNYAKEH